MAKPRPKRHFRTDEELEKQILQSIHDKGPDDGEGLRRRLRLSHHRIACLLAWMQNDGLIRLHPEAGWIESD